MDTLDRGSVFERRQELEFTSLLVRGRLVAGGALQGTRKYGKLGAMKTTLEIPDEVFRRSKAAAAMRGESLKDFVTESLRARLEEKSLESPSVLGWRRVFGKAKPHEVAEVDAVVTEEFSTIDPDSWR